jgi:2'-5' RNA ligase
MLRLFIALLFPDTIKAELGRLMADLEPRGRGIKWVEPKNIHLTLKFIGDAPETKVDRINQLIGGVVAGRKKFAGQIRGCGVFPNIKRPSVLWVGLEGADPAIEIAREIDHALVSLKIPAEKRPLSPHLTLGRVKKPGDLSVLMTYMQGLKFDAGTVILDRVALVKSTLTPSGPIYENLKVFELE